jgi:hypothetical protein
MSVKTYHVRVTTIERLDKIISGSFTRASETDMSWPGFEPRPPAPAVGLLNVKEGYSVTVKRHI